MYTCLSPFSTSGGQSRINGLESSALLRQIQSAKTLIVTLVHVFEMRWLLSRDQYILSVSAVCDVKNRPYAFIYDCCLTLQIRTTTCLTNRGGTTCSKSTRKKATLNTLASSIIFAVVAVFTAARQRWVSEDY